MVTSPSVNELKILTMHAHDFELSYNDIRFNQQFIHVMQSAISFEIAPVTYK